MSLLDDVEEGFSADGGAQDAPHLPLLERLAQPQMGGDKDAAHRLHGGDTEAQLSEVTETTELLEDLGGVPVPHRGEAVHGSTALGVVGARGRFGSGCGGADESVDDDGSGAIHDPRPKERRQRQNGRRRHAPGHADAIAGVESVAMQLGDAAREAAEKVGAGVIPAVPAWVIAGVVQTEVGGEVDEDGSEGADGVDVGCGLAVALRGEDDITCLKVAPCAEAEVADPPKVRVRAGHRLPLETLRGDLSHPHVGMTGEETKQLASRVPRRADDGGANRWGRGGNS